LDSHDVPALRSLLNDPRDDGKRGVRGNAAWRLGHLGDRESAVPIAGLLTDHLVMVRLSAADALTHIGNAATEPALIRALDDPNAMVRATAARALGLTGTRASVEPLRDLVARDQDLEARLLAVHALLGLGDPQAPQLASKISKQETFLRWGRRRLWRDLRRDIKRQA
jgi:HEAT repeat protein